MRCILNERSSESAILCKAEDLRGTLIQVFDGHIIRNIIKNIMSGLLLRYYVYMQGRVWPVQLLSNLLISNIWRVK